MHTRIEREGKSIIVDGEDDGRRMMIMNLEKQNKRKNRAGCRIFSSFGKR